MYTHLCGYVPNLEATRKFVAQPDVGRFEDVAGHLLRGQASAEKKDCFLWLPLLQVKPEWRRGSQGIGDCVSWGEELVCTMLMAIQHALGISKFEGEAATEPIYGGSRVEVEGGRLGGYSDGSWGGAAAKWVTNYGVLLRKDYSPSTGNPDHDLRVYSAKRAKDWGNFGCGGKDDDRTNGKLDQVAKQFPVKHVAQVTSLEAAEAAIQNGYPISVASNVGYGEMVRDDDGIVGRSGSWAHEMMIGGVKYHPSRGRLWRLFQSWGKSCKGSDPGIVHPAVSDCSWWITDRDFLSQLKQEDSFAQGDVRGFPPRELPWKEACSTFN
jgi:hypothetical protein